MSKNSQSRKYQITINNPKDKELEHGEITSRLLSLKSLIYFCLSDEIGGKEHTYHTHIFCVFENPKLFSTIKNKFPEAHIETARGSCSANRDYVFKQGKWKDTEKESTSIPGTQMEYGELPEERACPKPELALLYELIKEGKSNAEILEEYPEYMFDITHIDRCRLILRQEEFKNTWRNLEVIYIYGKTGTGKSRFVMEKYGYENVFRVTDYVHPFDTYNGEDVLMMEEFNSAIRMQDLLNYLDGYPLKLPARYSDKIACFTKVYFTTNLPLNDQYPNVKQDTPQVWAAFLRRINKVIWFKSETEVFTYDSMDEYNNRDRVTGFKTEFLDF